VGLKVTEKLEHEPARLYVQVHEQVEYGLSAQDQEEQTAPTKLAPLPPQPIDGLLAGPGLLARVLVAKYVEHLPLHRQESIFEREGLQIPRQTLCEWVLRSIELLLPIVAALRQRLLEGSVLQNDDTRVLCLENATGGGRRWAYLWAWVGVDPREVVYQFSLGRDHGVVKDWIGPEWSGHLVGDGYAGYRKICAERNPEHPIVEVGCWAHARRKVREAAEEAPKDAVQLAGLIRMLYAVEKKARQSNGGKGLEAEALRQLRHEESLPVLWHIRGLVRELKKVHADEGAMGKALTYIRNQWRSLRQYVKNGRLPIDNNACEQAIRPVAVGRKNWLFTGSPRGGEMGAAIYSLVESCKRAGVDPYEYLRDVLVRIRVHPEDRREELVPLVWKELRQAGKLEPINC
jgi:transposase